MTSKELEDKLIEKYMDIARGYYFEGSDEQDARDEYAPEFANRHLHIIVRSLTFVLTKINY